MSDLAQQLRAAREAAGHSLSRMAALTHFSKPYLGLIETGVRPVTADILDRYEQALGVPIGTTLDPVRVAHEWLITDTPAARHLDAGRHVGGPLLHKLEARVVELRHLDDTVSSTHLLPVVAKELADAETVTRHAAYTDQHAVRLLTVVGELSQLAGWIASDAGQYRQAQQLYLSGVAAAEQTGDRALGGQLLSCLAYQIANVGKRADALLIARSAVKGAGHATPVVRALLLERLAWAAARMKDPDTTRRALDAVDDAYEQRSPGTAEPEWVYWLNRAEIDVMAARCLIEIGPTRRRRTAPPTRAGDLQHGPRPGSRALPDVAGRRLRTLRRPRRRPHYPRSCQRRHHPRTISPAATPHRRSRQAH